MELKNLETGEVTTESYDKLVLSPGAPSVHPPLPGIDLPGRLPRTHRAGRAGDPRVDRARHVVPGGDVPLLGHPDGQAHAPRGGRGRGVHRPGDGREPDPRRVRGDAAPEAAPGPGTARPGGREPRRGLHAPARREHRAGRRGRGLPPAGGRGPRGADESREHLPGRRRHPGDRRASGHDAGQVGRAGAGRARRDPRRRPDAHQRPGHLRRRGRDRGQGLRHRASGAWWRWPGRRTARAASRPT